MLTIAWVFSSKSLGYIAKIVFKTPQAPVASGKEFDFQIQGPGLFDQRSNHKTSGQVTNKLKHQRDSVENKPTSLLIALMEKGTKRGSSSSRSRHKWCKSTL